MDQFYEFNKEVFSLETLVLYTVLSWHISDVLSIKHSI